MDQFDAMGHFAIGLDFMIWNLEVALDVGKNAYKDCDKFDDGTLCGLGSTCNNCKNTACKCNVIYC